MLYLMHSMLLGSGSVGRINVGAIKEAALHVTGGTSVHVGGVSGTEVVVHTGACTAPLRSSRRTRFNSYVDRGKHTRHVYCRTAK